MAKRIERFLQDLFGPNTKKGHLVLWTKRGSRSYFYSLDQLDEAASMAASLSLETDVYYGIGLQERIQQNGRGGEDSVIAIPGLWLDVDIQGDNHKSRNLPPDEESAMRLLESYNLRPTLIISTGGGFHAYWLFDQPMLLRNDEDREKAKNLSRRFQAMFRQFAREEGWEIDNTSDLSRLLRLPRTYNHKLGNPIPVRVTQYNKSSRFSLTEIEDSLGAVKLDDSSKAAAVSEIIPEGRRNRTLTSIAGSMRGEGREVEEIYQELSDINKDRCQPPLPSEEVHQIATSVSSYEPNNNGSGRITQAQRLLLLAEDMVLFHTPEGDSYAEIQLNDHRETWPLRSKKIREYLSRSFYEQFGTAPSSQAMENALGVLAGRASFGSEEKQVHVRLARFGDSIYLDLCNESWEVVEISPEGWRVAVDCPVNFVRSKGMKPVPRPEAAGKVRDLLKYINVNQKDQWIMVVSWLFGALNPSGPYPILILHGEQGSAKSTTAKILRDLIDPSSALVRSLPRSERDLMISAQNGRVLAFDNLSGINREMSDALCRLSTGGGLSIRGLYTDSDEVIFVAMRPIILNGIDDIANRDDLADRSLIVHLPRIPENKRRLENDLWAEFALAKPRILGALLDAVSCGIKQFDRVQLESYPRMADFAKWVVSAEPKLPWRKGEFLKTYKENRSESALACFESDALAIVLRDFIETIKAWEGTASDLKSALEEHLNNSTAVQNPTYRDSLPKSPGNLSNKLRRIAPALRKIGIEVADVKVQGRKLWRF
ncbi:MAG: primase alpha helix C-terminal domain-containing protein, partial [Candidatus Bathyarchaeota archaeon]|nr:primase alpha helix C-terminal domain-containing protein [Candidatus Bathyarchaeota archaeon]